MIKNKMIHANLKISNIFISLKQINHITIKLSKLYMNNNEENLQHIHKKKLKK